MAEGRTKWSSEVAEQFAKANAVIDEWDRRNAEEWEVKMKATGFTPGEIGTGRFFKDTSELRKYVHKGDKLVKPNVWDWVKFIWMKLRYPPVYAGDVVIIESWWFKLLRLIIKPRRVRWLH